MKGVYLLREAAENGNEFAPIYLVLFGKLRYIPVDVAEIDHHEKQLKESGHAISLSEESVPIIKRKKNWIQKEYDNIEFMYYLDDDEGAEEDDRLPTPFDPLLNLGRRIIPIFPRKGTSK